MANINNYDRLTKAYTFDNTALLLSSAASFAVGYMQYVIDIRLTVKQGIGAFPYWMHAFYLAHDSVWMVLLRRAATEYDDHWFLNGTSFALGAWSALEVWCIYTAVFKNRNRVFSSIVGPKPPLGTVMTYVVALQLAMYAVMFIGILFMGEGCFLQWSCLTNVIIVIGPTHEFLQRGSRHGLSLALCCVNIFGTILTFAPFGFWAIVEPEVFTQPIYQALGSVLVLYSIWCYWIVASYPAKTAKALK